MNWNELERKLYMSDDPELRKLCDVVDKLLGEAYQKGREDGYDYAVEDDCD